MNLRDEAYETPDSYEPDQYTDDDSNGDAAFDAFVAMVDGGEACFHCRARVAMQRIATFAGPLFVCPICNGTAFDFVTQPTEDAWTIPLFEGPQR